MRIKILMVGSKEGVSPDAEMLRERGFLVYSCAENTLSEMVDEIKPNVVFLNPDDGNDSNSIDTYNTLIDNVSYASYPVIYTLSEDDVYIVNHKRTASRNKRTVISDNIMDSIKTALIGTQALPKNVKKLPFPYYSNRA